MSRLHTGVLFLLLLAGTTTAAAQHVPRVIGGSVTYLAPPLAYLSVGRDSGLALGDSLTFYRSARIVARGIVAALSNKSSAATYAFSKAESLHVGDIFLSVKFVSTAPPTLSTRPDSGTAEQPGITLSAALRSERTTNIFVGRVGMQYIGTSSNDPLLKFGQPGLVTRLSVMRIAGSDLTFNTYNRLYYNLPNQATFGETARWQMRMYELSLDFAPSSGPFNVVAGRTTSRYVGSVGTFDGGLVSWRQGPFKVGVAGGARSYKLSTQFDGDDLLGAMFVSYLSPEDSPYRYEGTLTYTNQQFEGIEDREFLTLQNTLSHGSELWIYHSAEIEFLNVDHAHLRHTPSLSSSYLSVSYYPANWFSFFGGYDVSRTVYMPGSMRGIPDTLFSRDFLQTLRGGTNFRLPWRFQFSLNGTYRTQPGSPVNPWTAGALIRAIEIPAVHLNAAVRYTRIDGIATQGNTLSLDVDRSFGIDVSLLARAEQYEYRLISDGSIRTTTTFSLSGNYRVSSMVYCIATVDRVIDTYSTSVRAFAELGVRF